MEGAGTFDYRAGGHGGIGLARARAVSEIFPEDSVIARLLVLLMLAGTAFAQNTVHYTATNANVKYLFATAEPVAHLKAGDILETNTLDCFGNVLKKPGDTLSMVKGDNPLTGPFFVEGAEPVDAES
jgi:hypothetical protein